MVSRYSAASLLKDVVYPGMVRVCLSGAHYEWFWTILGYTEGRSLVLEDCPILLIRVVVIEPLR